MKYKIKNILSGMIGTCICFCPHLQAQSVLPNDSLFNQESMVEVAYGVQPEWQVTGSISSVSGEDLSKSFTNSVIHSLHGRLPGLVTQQGTGEAGENTAFITSRGVASFTGSNDLFVVIDGIPSSMTFFQQLTPLEIESVALWKDAAATALYGNRAANGVLVVTTKRGTVSPLKLTFNVQYGLQQLNRLPDYLGSYDYARLYNEASINDGAAPPYSMDALEAYRTGSDPYNYPNVDWYKQVLRDLTPMGNYNFNARGGTEDVKYFVLFNVLSDRGFYERTEKHSELTKNQSYTRYNFRTNLDIQLSRRLSMVANFGGTVEDKTTPGVNSNTYDMFELLSLLPPNAFPVTNKNGTPGRNAQYSNPWSDIEERGYVSYNGRALQATARLTGDLGFITEGLSISGIVGFNSYFRSFSKKTREYAGYDANGEKYGENTSLTGNEKDSYQWRNYVIQGQLGYDRTFGQHGVNAMAMASYDDYSLLNNYNDANNSSILPFKNQDFGGRFTYNFDKRYVAEFAFAYSGNDNFLRGNRYGFFPTGSLAWILSNEAFIKDNQAIDFLKLRSSYGLTGNKDVGGNRFPYNQYYWYRSSYFGDGNTDQGGLVQGTLSNPDATWEKDKMFNIGIDAVLLNSIRVNFDYFIQKRHDIYAMPYDLIPGLFGGDSPYLNIGKTENKGFEAIVRYQGKTSDVTWFAEGSAWYAKNKVIYNAESPKPEEYLYTTGNRIGQFFGLQAVGFFYDQDDIDHSPVHTFSEVQPGDIKYKDINNDGYIDDNDVVPIGYANYPELTLGFHAGATYKGFDLNLFFQGAVNRSVYLSGAYMEAFNNNGKVTSTALDRWAYYQDPFTGQTIDTRATASYPRLSTGDNANNYYSSTFWLKNGNFLKLRSLEVGYTLPENLLGKIQVEKIRVFFNGTNLFSIDNMDGIIDPEGGMFYPVPRTFSLGVNIQL